MPVKKKKKAAPRKKALKKKVIKRKPAKVVKRKPVRATKRKKAASKKPVIKIEGNVVGAITHYFPKVRAAVIKLKAPLSIGDMIRIKGHTTDFKQVINSLQIDRTPVSTAKKGEEIGLLVDSRVRQHDTVYKV